MLLLVNNALALGTFRRLNNAKRRSDKSIERLTSGRRINLARDDAAGLSIQESFKAQVRGLAQAYRNTQDGISLMQTADAAVENVGRQLDRMKQIAVEGANATLTDSDRKALDEEFQQLKDEIEALSNNSEFNNIKLLKEDKQLIIQTKHEPYQYEIVKLHKLDTASIGLQDISLSNKDDCCEAIERLDNAIQKVSDVRVDYGTYLNTLKSAAESTSAAELNTAKSLSKIEDADMAESVMEYVKNNILQAYSDSMIVYVKTDTQNILKLIS